MIYDDIVIGSGLTALATVIGLPPERRVLVVGGPVDGELRHYDDGRGVPSAYLGFGGLGRYWHGVIPTGLNRNPDAIAPADFATLLHHFYPRTDAAAKIGRPWLFVPKRPIRTPAAWQRLQAARGDRLTISHALASSFASDTAAPSVTTGEGRFAGRRLWIAAGALHTPRLLAASLDSFDGVRSTVSDHSIVYVGQIDRRRHPHIPAPAIERSPDGYWMPSGFSDGGRGLFTLKPARFSYRTLDYGIEQRAAFGLPTGGVIAKILKASSLGLVAEALFNKFGLFGDAERLSAYAQVLVPDAYAFDAETAALTARPAAIRAAIDEVRRTALWPDELVPSARPELFVNGIHLHHSVDVAALERRGINQPGALIQVVDASVANDIGAEHHSFKLMVSAFAKARNS